LETVTVGAILEFTLTISNPTEQTLTNVQVIDPLPTEVDFIDAFVESGSYNYDADSHTFSFNTPSFAPGETITIIIQVVVNGSGTAPAQFINKAILTSSEYGQIESNTISLFSIPSGVPVTGRSGGDNSYMSPILVALLIMLLLGLSYTSIRNTA
jgi:uncharacterized repeat protein (TIGR01451 family)